MQVIGSRARLLLILAVIAALGLRLTPLYVTGMPLDCDSWIIHYDIRVLRMDPSLHLLSSQAYDGYNNYWPASILAPYTLTLTTGYDGTGMTHLVGPLLDGLAVIPLYALARRLTDQYRATLAAIIIASSASMVGLGVGLVKETVARPLLYTLILTTLTGSLASTLLTSLGLALTHHLTSVIASLILLASIPVKSLLGLSSGSRVTGIPVRVGLIPAVVTGLYLMMVPPAGWRNVFTVFDPIRLTFYAFAFTLLAPLGASLIGEKPGPASTTIPTLILLTIVGIAAVRGLSPGIQAMGASAVYYMAPILFIAPLVAGALSNLRHRPWIRQNTIPYAWAFPLAGVVAYLSLSAPLGQSPAGRVANLMLPGLVLLYAYAGGRLFSLKALLVLSVSILYLQALLYGGDPESFDLPYHSYEYTTVALAASSKPPVIADAKMRDLAYYMNLTTKLPTGGDNSGATIIYRENLIYGYKLNSNLHTGNPDMIKSTLTSRDRVMDTGYSWITVTPSSPSKT